jgi:hypothetical protein
MEGIIMDYPENFTPLTCCTCSVEFAMTTVLLEFRQKDYRPFYCPNGHGMNFKKGSNNESIKKENTKLKIRVTHLEDQLQAAKENNAG